MKEHQQWHELHEVTDGDKQYIIKRYTPNSYEVKNELYWLTSDLISTCNLFQTPLVVDFSVEKGYIKMEKVDNMLELNPEEILFKIIALAVELHSVIKSPKPRLRNHASANEFIPYLRNFTENKFKLIHPDIEINSIIKKKIFKNLDKIVTPYFSVVHRDLRYRHVLQPGNNKMVLIDWEFSNISHFGHDLAKLICDYVVNHEFDSKDTLKIVIKEYSNLSRLPECLVFNAVKAFIPLVLLEHIASFVQRKCHNYLIVAQRDIEQLEVFVAL